MPRQNEKTLCLRSKINCPNDKTSRPVEKTLRPVEKTLRQNGKMPRQNEKTLCQTKKTYPLKEVNPGIYGLSVFTRSATSSISHLGVDVAPQTPTLRISSGSGSVMSVAEVINTERGFAWRH